MSGEQIKSGKIKTKGSTLHTLSSDQDPFEDDIGDATWGEVFRACCVHSTQDWAYIFMGFGLICFFLYFFLLGLDLLGSAAKVAGGCTAGSLLGDDTNPVAALMIGILATVFMQSSSTTTSIVVSLVGANTVGAKQAIYMIMGANIGTSVTNTIVAMGQMGDGDQLERAFAGATVHDLFNFLTVSLLFPIEVITGYLYHVTRAMTSDPKFLDGKKWKGPIKRIVSPLGSKILKANKDVIKSVAKGGSCSDYYPTYCNGTVNYKNCGIDMGGKVGLIACDKTSGECPAFFANGASQRDDEVSGYVCIFLALVILIVCLIGLVTVLQKMLLGMSTRILYKATNINGYLAILVGVGITILVQSSSITTSVLTPLVGMGALPLEQMLPLTLGANIGTTVTAFLAALVSDKVDSLRVALAHLFFNITGIIIFYPIPLMRNIPLKGARVLGKATRMWKGFPIVYILTLFVLLPFILFALSSLFEQNKISSTVAGSIIVVMLASAVGYSVVWWRCRGGGERCTTYLDNRKSRSEAVQTLPSDMDYIKAKLAALVEHTGLPEGESKPLNEKKELKKESAVVQVEEIDADYEMEA